jgi:hypothetical protein
MDGHRFRLSRKSDYRPNHRDRRVAIEALRQACRLYYSQCFSHCLVALRLHFEPSNSGWPIVGLSFTQRDARISR